MKKWVVVMGVGLVLVALSGCMRNTGPKVRVATATAAQLKAVEGEDSVWYEFQQGDVIPVQMAFFGVLEGGAREPLVFRAKRLFYFVMFKEGPMQISFDGSTFAGSNSSQSLIAVMPRRSERGGQLNWLIYMGESGDPKLELKDLIEAEPAEAEPAEAEPAETEPAPDPAETPQAAR